MFLKSITLKKFRNFTDECVNIKDKFIIITGENAQGKTNLLESIYFIGTGKSWRTKNYNELIKFEEKNTSLHAEFSKNNLNKNVEINIDNNGEKFIKVNGKNLNSERDYFGEINIVNFSPEDINIINGSPIHRRNFINFFLCQISKLYREHLFSYNRIVAQRNKILQLIAKNERLQNKEFDVWTEKLISEGIWIIERRMSGLLKFAEYFKEFYSSIYQNSPSDINRVFILYKSSIGFVRKLNPENINKEASGEDISKDFRSKLNEIRWKESKCQETIIGPHRDDIIFVLDNLDARKFSSRGEQRLLVLALKLAYFKIIEETLNETPVILIDDVLTELDENRRRGFLSNLNNNAQIFIAGTDEGMFDALTRCNSTHNTTKLKIKNGKIYT